jgi:hypothetical protein
LADCFGCALVAGGQTLADARTSLASGYEAHVVAKVIQAFDVAFGYEGDLFVAGGDSVYRIKSDYSVSVFRQDPVLFRSDYPALCFDNESVVGNRAHLYRLDPGGEGGLDRLTRIYEDGTLERITDGMPWRIAIFGLAIGPGGPPWNGGLYLPAMGDPALQDRVLRFDPTQDAAHFVEFATGFDFANRPAGCAFARGVFGNNLYVCGSRDRIVYVVDSSGRFTQFSSFIEDVDLRMVGLSDLVYTWGGDFGEHLFMTSWTEPGAASGNRLYQIDKDGNIAQTADFGSIPCRGLAFTEGGKFPSGLYVACGDSVIRIRVAPPPTPAPPRLRDVPDLRLLVGTPYPNVLDLRDYVTDADTPVENLSWMLFGPELLLGPSKFGTSNLVASSTPENSGQELELDVRVFDGQSSATETVSVKTSSFVIRPYQLAPIILHGTTPYRSSYRLRDHVIPEGFDAASLSWTPVPSSSTGVRSVEILPDTSFEVVPDGTPLAEPLRLTFYAVAGTPGPRPTPTQTPVSTPTSSPTPSRTATLSPTATRTATKTYTPTSTPTGTAPPTHTTTPTATPTATWTSTHTATATRTATPHPSTPTVGPTATPTATPIQVVTCDQEFNLLFLGPFQTGETPYDLAAGDFNEDGVTDLVTANLMGNSLSIFLGRGDGTFPPATTIQTDEGPTSIAVADMNHDGHEDLIVVHSYAQSLRTLLGDGRGDFSPGATVPIPLTREPSISTGATRLRLLGLGEMTGDGNLDAVVPAVEPSGEKLVLYRGDGRGGLEPASSLTLTGFFIILVTADFDGNGLFDVAVATRRPYRLIVYLNRGDRFEQSASFATDDEVAGSDVESLSALDADQDGKADLAASLFDGTRRLYFGRGDGTFDRVVLREIVKNALTESISAADLDMNGVPDLILLNREIGGQGKQSISIVCGAAPRFYEAAATFRTGRQASPLSRLSMVVADFNGDRRPDIAACDTVSNDFFVFVNRSGGDGGM